MSIWRLWNSSRTTGCITIASGGCNVLNYLAADPAKIIAVDLNPNHVALTRLKLSALENLPPTTISSASSARPTTRPIATPIDDFLSQRLDEDTRALLGKAHSAAWPAHQHVRAQSLSLRLARTLHRHSARRRQTARQEARCDPCGAHAGRTARRLFERISLRCSTTKSIRCCRNRRFRFYALGIPPAQYDELVSASEADPISRACANVSSGWLAIFRSARTTSLGRPSVAAMTSSIREAVPAYLRARPTMLSVHGRIRSRSITLR